MRSWDPLCAIAPFVDYPRSGCILRKMIDRYSTSWEQKENRAATPGRTQDAPNETSG